MRMKRHKKRGHRRLAKGFKASFLRKSLFKRKSKESLDSKVEEPANTDNEANVRRKRRAFGAFLRAALVLGGVFFSSLVVIFVALNIFLTKENVTEYIHSQVNKQLGANVKFQWEKYSFLTGFILTDIEIYLPKA